MQPGYGGMGSLPPWQQLGPPLNQFRTPCPPAPGPMENRGYVTPDQGDPNLAGMDQSMLQALLAAFRQGFVRTHPSPLLAPPYGASVEEKTARVVIGPATSPGNSAGATGATELASAEADVSGETISVLTPATTAAYVTVLSFTVPKGRLQTCYSVGAWGHDYYAAREVIKWRVRIGSTIVVDERELGLLGGIDNPTLIQRLAREDETVTIEARNLDTASCSLVEVRMLTWSFMARKAKPEVFEDVLDPEV